MNFKSLLGGAVENKKIVQIERGGPDKLVGELLEVRDDHLVIRTKENVVMYCVSQHIKSITEPVPRIRVSQSETEEEMNQRPVIPLVKAENFSELLGEIYKSGHFVQINTSGPNMLKGVIFGLGEDWVTVLCDMKEYVHYPMYHVRSISCVYEEVQDNQKGQNGGDNKGSEKQGEGDKKKGHGK